MTQSLRVTAALQINSIQLYFCCLFDVGVIWAWDQSYVYWKTNLAAAFRLCSAI